MAYMWMIRSSYKLSRGHQHLSRDGSVLNKSKLKGAFCLLSPPVALNKSKQTNSHDDGLQCEWFPQVVDHQSGILATPSTALETTQW